MEAFFEGLRLVLSWPAFGMLLLGTVIGLYLGAIPGLGGMVGFALLIPFTFGMDPVVAFALPLGMYAVTTTSDTLTAVLLGVPGTGAAAATVVDGYPMTKRGEAMRALGAAYTASAIGGVLGALSLAVSIPLIKPIIMAFGPPEFFMLGALGLTYVGALSGRSMSKGVIAALFGLLISTIGYSTQGGVARYTFEINYLLDGLELVPVILGLFAVPELIELASRGTPIASQTQTQSSAAQMWQGVRDAIHHRWLLLRASLIGIYIGILPGIGGAIADWVAYGHAWQGAKDKSQFGKGDVRGVIAPEAANNSVKGGDLIPTVAFGIPGSAAMAILLGAFLIHGLRPGPEMLTTKLSFTYSLVWTLAIANIIGALALMMWSRQLAKIAFMRASLIVPAIMLFAFMGAWTAKSQMGDWIALLVFGIIGVVFKRAGWPRPPIILGLVLGPIMENNLDLSLQVLGWGFLARPLVIAMIVLLAVSFAWEFRRIYRMRRDGVAPPGADDSEAAVREPAPSLPASLILLVLMLALCVVALVFSRQWSSDASMFPQAAAWIALALTGVALLRDGLTARAQGLTETGAAQLPLIHVSGLLAWLAATIALTFLLGQLIALPLMTALFLILWGRERWTIVLGQSVAAWLVLYVIFDRLMNVVWQKPLIDIF